MRVPSLSGQQGSLVYRLRTWDVGNRSLNGSGAVVPSPAVRRRLDAGRSFIFDQGRFPICAGCALQELPPLHVRTWTVRGRLAFWHGSQIAACDRWIEQRAPSRMSVPLDGVGEAVLLGFGVRGPLVDRAGRPRVETELDAHVRAFAARREESALPIVERAQPDAMRSVLRRLVVFWRTRAPRALVR